MVKQIILAVLIFTAGSVFGKQYVECRFSEDDRTIGAKLDNDDVETIYDTVSSALEAQKPNKAPSSYPVTEWRCGFGTDMRCP